ncbi:MAG: cytochrome C oxidase subunit IV family protein [Deltaproteobacteria bacterium]|nr:cytochrome C oxidase subunit IV family protein [Deltaproteobacteria bacterium]
MVSNDLYVKVWGALLFLTAATVGVSYLALGNITVLAAVIIASVKAGLVTLYFMHVRYERPLYVFMIVAALGFLGISLGLIFVDYSFR